LRAKHGAELKMFARRRELEERFKALDRRVHEYDRAIVHRAVQIPVIQQNPQYQNQTPCK